MVTITADSLNIRADVAIQIKNPFGLYIVLDDENQNLLELANKLVNHEVISVLEDGEDAVKIFNGYKHLDSIYRRSGSIYVVLSKEWW